MVQKNKNVLMGLCFAACALAGAVVLGIPANADKVTITVSSASEHVLYAYLWLAKEQGFFKAEDLDVEIALSKEDPEVIDMVSTGAQPFGAIAIEHFLAKPNSIPSIVPFMFFLYGESETSSYDTHLVVSKKSGIKSVRDLKGKNVRVGQPPTRIALEDILAEEGFSLEDVVLDYTPSHRVLEALQAGKIDAAITYYPTMPVILASGDVSILVKNIFANHVMDNVPQTAIGVNKDFAVHNPDVVKRFLSAMEKAFDHGLEHPEDVILSYAKLKEFDNDGWIVDADLLEKAASLMPRIAIKELDGFYVEDGKRETIFEVMQEYQELLAKEGFIDSETSLQPLWDNYQAFSSVQR